MIFETNRLLIRRANNNDINEIWNVWKNPENQKYMSDPVYTIKEVENILKIKRAEFDDYFAVIILKSTNQVIGTCCFGLTNTKNTYGIGYSIHKDFWNKGYATETLEGIIKFGESRGIKTFLSSCAEENKASKKVMEKCGMKFSHFSSFSNPILKKEYKELCYKLSIQ